VADAALAAVPRVGFDIVDAVECWLSPGTIPTLFIEDRLDLSQSVSGSASRSH
jgi:hypothetical protein